MGGWRNEWETTGYEAPVGTMGDGYRVRLRVERGRVVRFTVQFEVWIEREGRAYPAIRYDNAHGFAHRDTLDWHGRVVAKEPLPDLPYDQAVKLATRMIRANWRLFREEFEQRAP